MRPHRLNNRPQKSFLYHKVQQSLVEFWLLFLRSVDLCHSNSFKLLVTKQRQSSITFRNNAICGKRLTVLKLCIGQLMPGQSTQVELALCFIKGNAIKSY
jgi:hypothetical protein